jgi:poly(3-hydroxybutyrate) depolymerase
VWRAGDASAFVQMGNVAGPSFSDTGLAPQSTYRWHVTAIVGGAEGPISADVSATTKATPPPCAHPGTCPLRHGAN